MNYKIIVEINGIMIETLSDILPSDYSELNILIIAKVPALISVQEGHYFQGKQGKMLWKMLKQYNILNVPAGEYEDEHLLLNNYGITDIVKVPRDFGNEPSEEEYKEGLERIEKYIITYKPKILFFVYKKVLDKILRHSFKRKIKSSYGFNSELTKLFNTMVFVFPMPGTPCTRENAKLSMLSLKKEIVKFNISSNLNKNIESNL